MAQDVRHLGRHVERHAREALGEAVDHPPGVRRPGQEVGIAERDVAGARRHLGGDVVEDEVDGQGARAPVVDGRHRAVAAALGAAVGGLGVADDPQFVDDRQAGVALQRREEVAGGRGEVAAPEVHPDGPAVDRRPGGRAVDQRLGGRAGRPAHPGHQVGLVLAAEAGGEAVVREGGGVEAVGGHGDPGTLASQAAQHLL